MAKLSLATLLEQLTGEPIPFADKVPEIERIGNTGELGHSQLNEVLLMSGLDRVTPAFFAYLVDGSTEYTSGMTIASLRSFEQGVQRFRKTALLVYGNVKFAFKNFSTNTADLEAEVEGRSPKDTKLFSQRHSPMVPVEPIDPDDTYLTGYLIERELTERLTRDPGDAEAKALSIRHKEIVSRANKNQEAYLASDHLDVYVATSMRARHEFVSIGRLVASIFGHDELKDLKLRYFDPTQAYCPNRIDKGLSEALMLKRAACTIYLAQESDTLGKDSELASTLAQGKPVVAFVPGVDEDYLNGHFDALRKAEPGKSEIDLLLDQLRVFEPDAVWVDEQVRKWCCNPETAPIEELRTRVRSQIRRRYDTRARTLIDTHPLGIQVNLGSGVANGVLVVRSVDDCAKVVRGIVTSTLEFDVEETPDCIALKERISGCIFRVMTKHKMLTNSFWNFYLRTMD
jgi:hypothetical protein